MNNGNWFNKDINDSEPTIKPAQPDGEYHYVRPEQRLYEDAKFVPSDEDTSIPRYYVPEEKSATEKAPRKPAPFWLKAAALALCCLILGGLAGGFVAYKVQSNAPASPVEDPIAITSGSKGTDIASGAVSDIYSIACKQTVGITTEVQGTNIFGQTTSSAVSGTGFVVTEDGYILTNFHVVEYAYIRNLPITVMFYDGTQYEAMISGVEEDNDVAVLKIEADNLTPVTAGDSAALGVGDTVYAVGNPLGELNFSMTSGMVSALNRSITTDKSNTAIDMFQFDAAVNPGNSGGPVYNSKGEVVGVVTAKYSDTGVEGIGFAIPINDAVEIANEIITNGYVTGKAYMGITLNTNYSSVYANYYGSPEGAYVAGVEPGSCAEKAGIQPGDIITALGDYDVGSYADISGVIRKFKAGETTKVTVYRNGESIALPITFDEVKPDNATQ